MPVSPDTAFLFLATVLTILYAAALFALRSGLRKLAVDQPRTQDSPSGSHLPDLSIVVAARNEEKNLRILLSCLFAQDYPREKLEIIIVDDRSEDSSWEFLQRAAREHGNLKILRVTDLLPDFAPKKRALDLAIRSARGEIILLTDADCTPPPTWARAMVAWYEDGVAGVVGYSPYRFERTQLGLIEGMLALDYFSIFAVAAASAGLGGTVTASGTNLSYLKQTFLDVGGFESIKQWISGDDDLFVHEVARKKIGKFVFALDPKAYVPAAAPTSWRQFWNQRIRYASKSLQYGPSMTLGLLAFYLLNLAFLAGIALAVLDPSLWLSIAALWVAKAMFEMTFLSSAAELFHEERLLTYFFPTALLHPFYVAVFGFLGLFVNFRWKNITSHSR
jgi:cellulose synthase/poly-beta-1,6-N-acetylglucosamine synthase-like glycosyltransferase